MRRLGSTRTDVVDLWVLAATNVDLRTATREGSFREDLYHRLVEGGLRIKAKAPVTSIATSLKRDRRFRKVAPNTFEAVEEKLQAV